MADLVAFSLSYKSMPLAWCASLAASSVFNMCLDFDSIYIYIHAHTNAQRKGMWEFEHIIKFIWQIRWTRIEMVCYRLQT